MISFFLCWNHKCSTSSMESWFCITVKWRSFGRNVGLRLNQTLKCHNLRTRDRWMTRFLSDYYTTVSCLIAKLEILLFYNIPNFDHQNFSLRALPFFLHFGGVFFSIYYYSRGNFMMAFAGLSIVFGFCPIFILIVNDFM